MPIEQGYAAPKVPAIGAVTARPAYDDAGAVMRDNRDVRDDRANSSNSSSGKIRTPAR